MIQYPRRLDGYVLFRQSLSRQMSASKIYTKVAAKIHVPGANQEEKNLYKSKVFSSVFFSSKNYGEAI